LIRTVETGHNLVSRCDSKTVHTAGLFGFAFNSSISDTSKIISSNSSIQAQVFEETQTIGTSPHQSSGINHKLESQDLTLSILAHSLSIFVIATTIFKSASLAWFILSIVCGLTHSSAATTSTTISVDFAHLALIIVKASCPGVSRNVIFSHLYST